jgi:hypothetical protein
MLKEMFVKLKNHDFGYQNFCFTVGLLVGRSQQCKAPPNRHGITRKWCGGAERA